MNRGKYINFPIVLIGLNEPFDFQRFLSNVIDYHLYTSAKKRNAGNSNTETVNQLIRMEITEMGIEYKKSLNDIVLSGHRIVNAISAHPPMTGINVEVLKSYGSDMKTDFEVACLLAFLAIKSIVANKPYNKITNKYLFSRMSGSAKNIEAQYFIEFLKPFDKEYWINKIKFELTQSWGLVTYAKYTRGFYISFSLSLEDLAYEAEKNRISTKKKIQRQSVDNAYAAAQKKLVF